MTYFVLYSACMRAFSASGSALSGVQLRPGGEGLVWLRVTSVRRLGSGDRGPKGEQQPIDKLSNKLVLAFELLLLVRASLQSTTNSIHLTPAHSTTHSIEYGQGKLVNVSGGDDRYRPDRGLGGDLLSRQHTSRADSGLAFAWCA